MLKKYTLSILMLFFIHQISFAQRVPGQYIIQTNVNYDRATSKNALKELFGYAPIDIKGPIFQNVFLVHLIGDDDVEIAQLSGEIDTSPGAAIVCCDYNYTGLTHSPYVYNTNPTYLCNDWPYDLQRPLGNHPVDVAVFDTGLAVSNPDQSGLFNKFIDINDINSWGNDYIDGLPYPWDSSYSNHGTSIASIILRNFDKNHINQNLRFQSYKTHSRTGHIDLFTFMTALEDAVLDGINVINLSFSYPESQEYKNDENTPIINLLDWVEEQGVLLVAAAGNDNINLDDPNNTTTYYPAAFKHDNILTVGASTCLGDKYQTSNYGSTSVDVFANGESVSAYHTSGVEVSVAGTSAATALITAVALQLGTLSPTFDYARIKCAIVGGTFSAWGKNLKDLCASNGNVYGYSAWWKYNNHCSGNQGFVRADDGDEPLLPEYIRQIKTEETRLTFDGQNINLNIITLNNTEKIAVTIFDVMGRQVANHPVELVEGIQKVTVEVPQESPQGVYFARILRDNQRMETIKFFKYDLR